MCVEHLFVSNWNLLVIRSQRAVQMSERQFIYLFIVKQISNAGPVSLNQLKRQWMIFFNIRAIALSVKQMVNILCHLSVVVFGGTLR